MCDGVIWHFEQISIHAPAWGATGHMPDGEPVIMISIHAPAWGATLEELDKPAEPNISIHAPAWGATMLLLTGSMRRRHFNPRSRVGSDCGAGVLRLCTGHFNPRSRVGSDPKAGYYKR